MKYLLIRESDGLVENIIEISETSNYHSPNGYKMCPLTDIPLAGIGDVWDGEILTKKEAIIHPKTLADPISKIFSSILIARGLRSLTEDEKSLLDNTLPSRGQLPV